MTDAAQRAAELLKEHRQSIDRLFAGGNLRVLAQQAVVEGALNAVAQAALRNSVDFTL